MGLGGPGACEILPDQDRNPRLLMHWRAVDSPPGKLKKEFLMGNELQHKLLHKATIIHRIQVISS